MRIQVVSDLHLEFLDSEHIKDILCDLTNTDSDVLVIAGDLHIADNLPEILNIIADRTKNVVFVPGNHEYYNTAPYRAEEILNNISIPNVHVLNNSFWIYEGRRFVGSTLWFPDNPLAVMRYRNVLTDFKVIEGFDDWVINENTFCVNFLKNFVDQDDIVITHHAPSARSTEPNSETFIGKEFFYTPLDDFIEDAAPKVWVHGHMHRSRAYDIGDTHVVCNPKGYLDTPNVDFSYNFTITV